MTHHFPIKEIATQSGLSTATVDRVLNSRPNVSAQTKARVLAAIDELEGQAAQLAARGRRLFVDIVVEAPPRFTREIRRATEAVLPLLHPVILRPRFLFEPVMTTEQTCAALARIAKRGSNGICLKARDTPEIRASIRDLAARNIPVVTLVTDIPNSNRVGYAGLDNQRAGQTAAHLIASHLQTGTVLLNQSRSTFEGEDTRLRGFLAVLQAKAPNLTLCELPDAGGLEADTGKAMLHLLAKGTKIDAVYSMGGGNRAIHNALATAGQSPKTYVAHDLDEDNLALLQANALSHVLHHDLAADMSHAFRHLMAAHRLIPPLHDTGPSDVQIIVPTNIPRARRSN